jgi:hypothetical protein
VTVFVAPCPELLVGADPGELPPLLPVALVAGVALLAVVALAPLALPAVVALLPLLLELPHATSIDAATATVGKMIQ